MVTLSLKVQDKNQITCDTDWGERETGLVVTRVYEEGDRILLEASEGNLYLMVQLDDGLGPCFVYLKENKIRFQIPFGEKRICYSPKAFCGDRHYLWARLAEKEEIEAYKNLAVNIIDSHQNDTCYPHASANVETRGESVFAARNAIDGVRENRSHGAWPYASWGINQQADAKITIQFGRCVKIDKIGIYLRADFPHDNWWKQVTITGSDGSSFDWELTKTGKGQVITFTPKCVEWVEMSHLISSEEPSPFPALAQLEIYGTEV